MLTLILVANLHEMPVIALCVTAVCDTAIIITALFLLV